MFRLIYSLISLAVTYAMIGLVIFLLHRVEVKCAVSKPETLIVDLGKESTTITLNTNYFYGRVGTYMIFWGPALLRYLPTNSEGFLNATYAFAMGTDC
jgi:hypothetical protein